ncbi:RagB/SusD family nutrient uptake outer membrane protein [uncultured Draconibacterium sp.]|uniref:RagB/SusD family nutrient uptake outer membrane protein n=1 Tax=uncultured Draconibacterium sp. TaxID=1573823 RepID=UPI003216F76D
MKHIFSSILIFILVAVSVTSCNEDLLDIEQQGVMGLSTYQTGDDTQVKQFISAVYALVLGDSYQAVLAGGQASYRAVNYEMSRMSAESANYYVYQEGSDARTYSYIWSYYYKIAYYCNMILEGLPENNVASENVKSQVMAEARAIRAIAMMNLVQLYGNPPLADHVMDGSELNTPASESWAFIESELEAAAGELPTKSGLGGQEAVGGRLTQEAAYAYLGKAQLWQAKYNEAANTLYNKVIATGKYALNPNFATLNSSAVDFSDENIWEFNFSDDPSVATAQEGTFDIACYSPAVPVWYFKYASIILGFGLGSYPSDDFATFLENHDGKDNSRYQETLIDYYTASMMGYVSLPIDECEGYIKVKDMCLAEDLVGDFPYYFNKRSVVYMRYAEVLLNYAEAIAMGGSPGAMSGLDALNMVRNRAGLEDAPSLDMDNAEYGVKAERRAELYGEGHRFIDLVRWGDAPQVLADCGKQAVTFNGLTEDGSFDVVTAITGGPGFKSGKNELFPIPTSDLNNNPSLIQNPGW